MATLEESMIEDTFQLLKQFDECSSIPEAMRLEQLIMERSESIGLLVGYVLKGVDGEVLVACLNEEQARAVQQALLLVEGGMVSVLAEEPAAIIDFVHPETEPGVVALSLAD